MKRYFRLILAGLLAGTLCLNTVSPAQAAESPAEIQTAAAYLDQLVECGLLSKEKVGRDNIYKNIKLLELFENDSEEAK